MRSVPLPLVKHIVASAAIDGLAARSAGDDIVERIPEGITAIACYPQVLEILGQGVAHPGVDRVDAFAGVFHGAIDAGIEIINIVACTARHRHIDGAVAPHGIIAGSACQQGAGTRGGKKSLGIAAVIKCVSKRIHYCPGHEPSPVR